MNRIALSNSIIIIVITLAIYGCSTDPIAPLEPVTGMRIVTTFATPGSARDIWVEGGIAYVADSEFGITIWDGLPTQPTLFDTIATRGPAIRVTYSASTNLLVVAEGNPKGASLRLYERASKQLLTWIGSEGCDGEDAWTIASDTLIVASTEFDYDGVQIIKYYYSRDFNCWSYDQTGRYNSTGLTMHDVRIDYPYLYIAQGERGLLILELTGTEFGPSYPIWSKCSVDIPGNALGIALIGTKRYALLAAQYAGLQIIDLADPANPKLASGLTPEGVDDAFMVAADGDTAYLLDRNNGMFVVDFSNSLQPELIWTYRTPAPSRLFIDPADHTVYLADEQRGIVGLRW